MHYVYVLQSEADPAQWYTGLTSDLRARLAEHNSGKSPHTAKFKPWELVIYLAFPSREKAAAFEAYLKTGSAVLSRVGICVEARSRIVTARHAGIAQW